MTLTKANVLGFGFNEKLTSDQVNHLQDELVKALDGAGGGTYAPTDPIIIGGDGLAVTTTFSAGSATVTGPLSVIGTSTLAVTEFTDTVTVDVALVIGTGGVIDVDSGAITLAAAGFQVGGGIPAEFNGATTFNADATFAAGQDVLFNEGFVVATGKATDWGAAAVQISDTGILAAVGTNVQLDGTVALSGVLTPSGAGHVRSRPAVALANADATLGIADSDVFIVPNISAARIYTLTSTGASNGDRILINAIAATGFTATIVDDSAVTITAMQSTIGNIEVAEFMMVSGAWRVVDRGRAS